MPKRQIKGGTSEVFKRKVANSNLPRKKRICKEKREIINQNDFNENCKFVHIINSDNFCLVRAVLIGKAIFDKEHNANLLRRVNNRELNKRVKEVVETLGLPNEHLNLDHLEILELYFKEYRITLYDSIDNGSDILYPRSSDTNDKRFKFINICFDINHYNLIVKMTSYLNCSYFCEYCKAKYSNLGDHKCENLCQSCFRYNYICNTEKVKVCFKCKIESRNKSCKNLHDSGQCYTLRLCKVCGGYTPRTGNHVCVGERWCPNCKKSVDFEHMCFIKTEDKKKIETKFGGYVWFDMECFVNENNFHEANLIMAKRKCSHCLLEREKNCLLCDVKYSFENVKEFISWALLESNKNFIFISHNGKSYDNYFIMRYLQKSKTTRDSNVEVLIDDLKVLCMKFCTLTFKDSSLFIKGCLESFPKTFGLRELKKG
jgi:hypothetical protein